MECIKIQYKVNYYLLKADSFGLRLRPLEAENLFQTQTAFKAGLKHDLPEGKGFNRN